MLENDNYRQPSYLAQNGSGSLRKEPMKQLDFVVVLWIMDENFMRTIDQNRALNMVSSRVVLLLAEHTSKNTLRTQSTREHAQGDSFKFKTLLFD
jgi:hypothetical protein